MKRTILCALLLSCAACSAATPDSAQNGLGQSNEVSSAPRDEHCVRLGDNLWQLSQDLLGDAELWREVKERNPFLNEPGRVFERGGKTIVLLKEGECLTGLRELGITNEVKPVRSDEGVNVVARKDLEIPNAAWWLLALVSLALVLTMIWRLFKRGILQADPVRTGLPQVPGGVTDETARERFNAMGTVQRFTVLEQVPGRVYGIVNVRYANNREVPREMSGQRAFRARVQHDNGSEEELYMLQGCGNDLRYGGISRYIPGERFRFEPDAVEAAPVQPAAEPAAPAAPAQDAPTPAAAVSSETDIEQGTVVLELRRGSGANRSMLRVRGVDLDEVFLTIAPRETTIRFTEMPAPSAE